MSHFKLPTCRPVSGFLVIFCIVIAVFALAFAARRNNAGAEPPKAESAMRAAGKSVLRIKGKKEDIFKIDKKKSADCCGAKSEATSFSPMAAAEGESYKLTAVYYSVHDRLATTLMLNNKGPQPLSAVPTVYSMAGTRLSLVYQLHKK